MSFQTFNNVFIFKSLLQGLNSFIKIGGHLDLSGTKRYKNY